MATSYSNIANEFSMLCVNLWLSNRWQQ